MDGVTLAPLPVQRPRVPVWIGGASPPARRRAARWDGWIFSCDDEQGDMIIPPADIAAAIAAIAALRPADDDARFDVAITGVSAGPGDPVATAYAQAGATWWLEHVHGRRGSHASMLARIGAGPNAQVSARRYRLRPDHGRTQAALYRTAIPGQQFWGDRAQGRRHGSFRISESRTWSGELL